MAGNTSRPDIESTGDSTPATDSNGIDWKRALASIVMALIIGGLGAWATTNLGISLPVFLLLAAGSTYYLYQKPIATKSIGVGLYIAAGVALLVPLVFYLPMMLSPGEGAEGAGTFIGSLLGFFVWGALFAAIALISAGVGYFVNKRANRKLDTAS